MRRGRRAVAVLAVLATGLVACVGALKLSSTTQKNVVLSVGTNPYNFGPVDVGSSGSALFSLTPATGSDDDYLTMVTELGAGCTAFTPMGPPPIGSAGSAHVFYSDVPCGMTGGTLVATGSGSGTYPCSYNFGVTFAPTTSGAQSCTLRFDIVGAAGASTYDLMLGGTGNQTFGLSASTHVINFGNVATTGGTATQSVTVTNTGTAPLGVTTTKTDPAGYFSTSPPVPATHNVGAGGSDMYMVTCDPTMDGSATATLSFDGSGSGGGSSDSTMLLCTGITTNLDITPIPVTFANTLVGLPPPDKMIMITNNGASGTLGVAPDTTAAANGVSVVGNPNGALANGQSRNVTIHYAAPAMHAGSLGNLTVTITGGNNFDVGLNGQADLGGIATNPASMDLGTVCAGGSASKAVNVYGTGPGDVQLTGVTQPMAPTPFSVAATPGTIKGSHANELAITATVSPTTAGDYDASFDVLTNIPAAAATTVQLHAKALDPGTAATPNPLHFGAVMTKVLASGKPVTLTNCGTADLMITGAHFEGAMAGEFGVAAPPSTEFPKVLHPTDQEPFLIVMTPALDGLRVAQLIIETSTGPIPADVDGTGFGGTTDGGKDRETYYACSTGRPAGAWPIALALLALRRRRR